MMEHELLYDEEHNEPPYVGIIPNLDNPSPEPQRCPIHAEPDSDMFMSWPCPVAVEGDPPGYPTCGYFAEMLSSRMKDFTETGHYFRMFFPGEDDYPGQPGEGRHYEQEFNHGEPVGVPKLAHEDEPYEGYNQANSTKCPKCEIPCGHCNWLETCDHEGECHDFDWFENPCTEHAETA